MIAPNSKGEPYIDPTDTRKRMIAETSAFLTWALQQQNMPQIPRRRVREGGFGMLMNQPGAKRAVVAVWDRLLERFD